MQFGQLKRREFVSLLTGAASWPLTAWAQQPSSPLIGFLSSRSPDDSMNAMAGFKSGLQETGFVEGQNLAIEYRWAQGRLDQLPSLAADLVQRKVVVIFATGSTLPAVAAKAATATIPIVFTGGEDPVRSGLIMSLSRPGGNATGVVNIAALLDGKRVELLRELAPNASALAFLVDPNNPSTESETNVKATARSLGQQYYVLSAGTDYELDAVFATIPQHPPSMLLVQSDPFFLGKGRQHIVALAAQYAIPASYPFRDYVDVGGLMSYGADLREVARLGGVYTGRILRGAKTEELPVIQPTRFQFVINLKTARALGLTVPPTLLARADEVIE